MSVQIAISKNSSKMHFSLGLGLNPVCETGTSIIAGSIQRRDETDSSILEA